MNKTLLLIICDFLLLNLLALTRWDAPIAAPQAVENKPLSIDRNATPAATQSQDIVDVMKLSLEDEQARRDELARQLALTNQTLDARNQNITQLEAQKTALETQKTRLETQKNQVEAQKTALASQLETQKTELTTQLKTSQQTAAQLQQQLQNQADAAQRDATASKERLAQLQRDLETREADLARANTQVTKLEQTRTELSQQNKDLTVAVEVAKQENSTLRETTDTLKTQVAAERDERLKAQSSVTQLAQGVTQVADTTATLTQEIRDNRPMNANTLFNEFLSNNVNVRFETARPGMFGASQKTVDLRTILVSDGKETYALFHTDDTPLALSYPGADLTRVLITLSRGNYTTAAGQAHFLSIDPRILVVPVTAEQAAALGVKVYLTTLEPFKFSEAVLISTGGTKYEETPFKLDPAQPGFVRMKVSLFSSKRGDIAISKTGELLGIMVNKDYCALINNFLPAKTIKTGADTGSQRIGGTINALVARVQALPLRLQ